MESHANSVEDQLVSSLQFKLGHGASYATDRRSVSYFSMGSNSYAPNGVNVIKIGINGTDWLDPQSVKLFFDVQNTQPSTTSSSMSVKTSHAWAFFRRMRVTCGGVILEDIDNYARLHTMMHMLKTSHDRDENDNTEGFGDGETLANGKSRTCCFTPLSGILYQKNISLSATHRCNLNSSSLAMLMKQ